MLYRTFSDLDLVAEYTLANQETLDLLRHYGPAALALPAYPRAAARLSAVVQEQQRRAAASARAVAA